MSLPTEEQRVDGFAKSIGINPEMFARAGGDEPIWIGADPAGGWVYFLCVGPTGCHVVQWSAVQGENVKLLHDRAMSIVESGVGSMR